MAAKKWKAKERTVKEKIDNYAVKTACMGEQPLHCCFTGLQLNLEQHAVCSSKIIGAPIDPIMVGVMIQ